MFRTFITTLLVGVFVFLLPLQAQIAPAAGSSTLSAPVSVALGQDTSAVNDLTINPSTKSSGMFLDLKINGTTQLGFGLDSAAPTYGRLTLNGSLSPNGGLGIAGKAGDASLYIDAPTGGTFHFRINGTSKASIDSNGAISIGNTVNSVSPTSPNRTVTIVINGTTYYLAAKTTND